MSRIQTLQGQLIAHGDSRSGSSSSKLFQVSDSDVVICSALRTPLTRAKKGGLRTTPPEEMLHVLFKATLDATRVPPSVIGDIQVGNVLQSGSGMVPARIAALMAGIPDTVPICSLNRQCSSGLQACANIYAGIKAGMYDAGLAAGVESMSMYDMMGVVTPTKLSSTIFDHEGARTCLIPMGLTSENVAEKFGIDRKTQDEFAVRSHAKAAAAQKKGLFDSEIVPMPVVDKDTGKKIGMVTKDDGIREDTTFESLNKLSASFRKGGSTTAGNASQVTDGAGVVLLARRSAAKRLGLPIIGKFVDFVAVGCPPEIMGIGPAVAIPKVLERCGVTVADVDIFELNEAFASQATYCMRKLGIPETKVNPKGGAIALGHPLGATGARQVATLIPELKRTNKRVGVISMCVGAGMGCAALIVAE